MTGPTAGDLLYYRLGVLYNCENFIGRIGNFAGPTTLCPQSFGVNHADHRCSHFICSCTVLDRLRVVGRTHAQIKTGGRDCGSDAREPAR